MEEIDSNIGYLKCPANFIITGSGKTYFLLNLLKDWPFQAQIRKLIYFYET